MGKGGGEYGEMGGEPFVLASPLFAVGLSTEAVRPAVDGAFELYDRPFAENNTGPAVGAENRFS